MIIIGSGSRDWRDIKPIRFVMAQVMMEFGMNKFIYFHGAQRGFDVLSSMSLKRLGHTMIEEFPYISELGKAGGMARNRQMLTQALEMDRDVLLVAMPLPQSIGTYGMINISKNAKIKVRIYDSKGNLIES